MGYFMLVKDFSAGARIRRKATVKRIKRNPNFGFFPWSGKKYLKPSLLMWVKVCTYYTPFILKFLIALLNDNIDYEVRWYSIFVRVCLSII